MKTIELAYIDKNYTICFEVQSDIEVFVDGEFNANHFDELILTTVDSFGKTVDLPEPFFAMQDDHLDSFLINIHSNLVFIISRFYLAIPSFSASKLISNSTASYYKVKGYNPSNIAVEAIHPEVKDTLEVVWGAHEVLLREFTYI